MLSNKVVLRALPVSKASKSYSHLGVQGTVKVLFHLPKTASKNIKRKDKDRYFPYSSWENGSFL